MYAVIETGGKQYQVQEGDIVFVEKLPFEENSAVTFDKVFMVKTDEDLKVGTPYVEGASVAGTLIKNGKGKKVIVFTYKKRKGQKRKMGHRQPYSKVQIDKINV